MEKEPTPTRDIKVDLFHAQKALEKWHGFVLEVPDGKIRDEIKTNINDLLNAEGFDGARIDGERILFKGAYTPDILDQLRQHIDRYMENYSHNPLEIEGSYFSFLDDPYWTKKAIEQFRTH